MGIFNKVVNILVLVFAIAGVTFSYLLFNKREQLVAGWEEMSQSIAQTAKALEQNSGLKLSAKLNADTLGHKSPDNADLSGLKRNLPELSKAAKQITAQRSECGNHGRQAESPVGSRQKSGRPQHHHHQQLCCFRKQGYSYQRSGSESQSGSGLQQLQPRNRRPEKPQIRL